MRIRVLLDERIPVQAAASYATMRCGRFAECGGAARKMENFFELPDVGLERDSFSELW